MCSYEHNCISYVCTYAKQLLFHQTFAHQSCSQWFLQKRAGQALRQQKPSQKPSRYRIRMVTQCLGSSLGRYPKIPEVTAYFEDWTRTENSKIHKQRLVEPTQSYPPNLILVLPTQTNVKHLFSQKPIETIHIFSQKWHSLRYNFKLGELLWQFSPSNYPLGHWAWS